MLKNYTWLMSVFIKVPFFPIIKTLESVIHKNFLLLLSSHTLPCRSPEKNRLKWYNFHFFTHSGSFLKRMLCCLFHFLDTIGPFHVACSVSPTPIGNAQIIFLLSHHLIAGLHLSQRRFSSSCFKCVESYNKNIHA
jgi:hypothetical protein